MRIGVVLSAGGLRGAAHVGVLRQLIRRGLPIDVLVGASAGAIVAAYYAAVGLDFADLISDATTFRGRHLLAHSVSIHLDNGLGRLARTRCGVIPKRLAELQHATFDRLHHGVTRLGIVCHDVRTKRPCYFATGLPEMPPLESVVKASASIPHLFPSINVRCGVRDYRLTDGGISDPVPIAFARHLGATHIVVSDSRWIGRVPATSDDTIWIRPRLASTGTLWSPRRGLRPAVESGEAAVTGGVLARIDRWFAHRRADVSARAAAAAGVPSPPPANATRAC
jgi:NTE family protein